MSGIHDWEPIGAGDYPFMGVFDGGGHEITGFHCTGARDASFSLMGETRNAEIRNVIFREPVIAPSAVTDDKYCFSVIAGGSNGLTENCAVIGGRVAPAGGGAVGLVGSNSGILLSCFNSADVICVSPKSALQNTGGVVGNNTGYCAYLANEGEVYGTHLQGGICGWHHGGAIVRSINSGYVWGHTLVGEFPPGGIVHTVNDGAHCAYGYFVRGEAATGGKAFTQGTLNSLMPIDREDLQNPAAMPYLGSFEGENPDWAFWPANAKGPVPYGVFQHLQGREAP
jgi:hypothetical protein